jgi:DNA adenine methylase
MWRHNPEGNFNVGYGGEERRWVITRENLIELSRIFRKANILQSDFEKVLDDVSDGDFIFLDPPYKPGEIELLEAHYTNSKFTFGDQVRLANKLKQLSNSKKIKWLMTNSAHHAICNLYKTFIINAIPRGTSNVIGVSTNNSNEVVISNY